MNRMRTVAAAALLASGALMPAAVASESEAVELGGEPVQGSTRVSDPTEVDAGVWSDTLEAGETTHHYSYQRTTDFSAVHVGVIATTKQDIDSLEIEGSVSQDDLCGSASGSPAMSYPNVSFGTQLSFLGEGPEDRNDPCLTSDEVHFSISHTGEEAEMPMAITVVEEQPTESGSTVDLPTVPETEPSYSAPDVSGSDDVEGATSFDDAPVIDDGAWKDTITSGDELLYAVDVDWGQTLAVRVTSPTLDEKQSSMVEFDTPSLGVGIRGPSRSSISAEPEGATTSATLSDEEDAVATAAVGPVRYLNRFEDSYAYLPGRHWISVRLSGRGGEQPIEVPIEVQVEAQGEPEGQPTYEGDADEPFLVAEDTWAERVADGSGGSSMLRIILGAGLGLVGAVCIGAGSLRLRRR